MEIEDLKYIWSKQPEGFERKNQTELATMLKGTSRSIIARLKRNVWIELVITSLGSLALLGYALTLQPGALKWASVSILVLFVLYSLYYLKKLRLLNRFDPGNDNLKGSLRHLIHSLTGYLKFYRRSYSILYPVCFVLGLAFTAIEQGATGFVKNMGRPQIYIPLALGGVFFFFCSTWLTRWYLKKLYGDHVAKLEGLLRELE